MHAGLQRRAIASCREGMIVGGSENTLVVLSNGISEQGGGLGKQHKGLGTSRDVGSAWPSIQMGRRYVRSATEELECEVQ